MKRSFFVLLAFLFAFPARAACPLGDRPVVVGVPMSEPFVIPEEGDALTGFDVELWREVAAQIGCKTTFTPITFDERIPALTEHRVDAVMGGFTITADREQAVDFSHGYFNAGQAAMTRNESDFHLLEFIRLVWESTLKVLFVGLFVFVLFWAHVLWLAEHFLGNGDTQFNSRYLRGVFEAAYFVNVTMTTVGYGDYTPKTFWGRSLTIAMMWTGIAYAGVCLAAITAFGITYATSMHTPTPSELKNQPVAVVRGTTSESAAHEIGAELVMVTNLAEAIVQLESGAVKAVVFDEPDLRYYVTRNPASDFVVSPTFTEETYGIALQPDSPLRDTVNQAILRARENGAYATLKTTYFGATD